MSILTRRGRVGEGVRGMPTYVYACKECSDRNDVMQRMPDAPLTDCRQCGRGLRRVLVPQAVVLKDSGVHTPDYQTGGRRSESSADSGSSTPTSSNGSDSASKPEAKTETKSEAKTEA